MDHEIRWVVKCWGNTFQGVCIEHDRFVIVEWLEKAPVKSGKLEKAWRAAKGIHPDTVNALQTLFRMNEITWDDVGRLIVQPQQFQMSNIHRITHQSQLNELPLPK